MRIAIDGARVSGLVTSIRLTAGTYELVSVEMIEAVGFRHQG